MPLPLGKALAKIPNRFHASFASSIAGSSIVRWAMTGTSSLSDQLMQSAGISRTDLMAIDGLGFWSEAAGVFWDVWHPDAYAFPAESLEPSLLDEIPPLPSVIEEAMLTKLEGLERSHMDVLLGGKLDDQGESLGRMTYIHIAGARAIALSRARGYTDDTRDCLQRAWQNVSHIDASPNSDNGTPALVVSTWAVAGIVLQDLFKAAFAAGEYGQGLHALAKGLGYVSSARRVAGWSIEGSELEGIETESSLRYEIEEGLSYLRLEPQMAVDALEHMFELGREVDWPQVIEDCDAMIWRWEDCGRDQNEDIHDSAGRKMPWWAYWYRAEGRARERLRPSELRDLRERVEDQEAELRLKSYFFDFDLWLELPERAQRGLVMAERAWFATKSGRIESVLSELQIAVESLLYPMIWKPLAECNKGLDLMQIIEWANGPRRTAGRPNLGHYAWVCKEGTFGSFWNSLTLSRPDIQFLRGELPCALETLKRLRNMAEHEPERKWRREEVAPVFKKFLGIGESGVLPQLAEVKRGLGAARQPLPPTFTNRTMKSG